jgi:HEAT repeat protein
VIDSIAPKSVQNNTHSLLHIVRWSVAVLGAVLVIVLVVNLVMVGLALFNYWTVASSENTGSADGTILTRAEARQALSATDIGERFIDPGVAEIAVEYASNQDSGADGSANPRKARKPARSESLEALLNALENAKGHEIYMIVQKLWLFAADNDVPEEILNALDRTARSSDHSIAEISERALRDLRDQKNRLTTNELTVAMSAEIIPAENGQEGSGRENASASRAHATSPPSSKVQEMLQSPDANVRFDAARSLGNHRTENTVASLSTAAMDENAMVRQAAIESLWRTAADNTGPGQAYAWSILQRAVSDPVPEIAQMAQNALLDLTALSAARTSGSQSHQTPGIQDQVVPLGQSQSNLSGAE